MSAGGTFRGRFETSDDPARNGAGLDVWIAKRILAGWRPRAIEAATDGRVSRRTAYRWRAELVGLEVVRAGGYEATFAVRRDRPPRRLTSWQRIEEVGNG